MAPLFLLAALLHTSNPAPGSVQVQVHIDPPDVSGAPAVVDVDLQGLDADQLQQLGQLGQLDQVKQFGRLGALKHAIANIKLAKLSVLPRMGFNGLPSTPALPAVPAVPGAPAIPAPPMPPLPPIPPATPLVPDPSRPHLLGSWQGVSAPRVSVAEDTSIDDAVTHLSQEANWNLVLNTDSNGEDDIPSEVKDMSAEEALDKVLSSSSLMAARIGNVIVVARDEQQSPLAQLNGLGDNPAKVSLRGDEKVDEAIHRIAEAAHWNIVINSAEEGDALLRLRLTDVPVLNALAAVLWGTSLVAQQIGPVVVVARAQDWEHSGSLAGLAAANGARVNLSGKKSIDSALEKIGKQAGWNVDRDTESIGDELLILDIDNVPAEQVVRAILAPTSLSARKSGNSLAVSVGVPEHDDDDNNNDDSDEKAAPADVLVGFDQPLNKNFSGDFNDTPLDQALRKVTDSGGLSLLLPRSLRGTVTAHFQNAPVEDVLRAVCTQGGLRATRQGTVVTIVRAAHDDSSFSFSFSSRAQEQVERAAERAAERAQRAAEREQERAEHEQERAQEEAERAQEEASRNDHGDSESGSGSNHNGDQVVTGDVSVGPGERVRDLVAMHGDAKLGPGAHAREVTAVMGTVDIGPGAVVDRGVTAVGGDVHVAPGARVGRTATSVGGRIIVDPGGIVLGERSAVKVPNLNAFWPVAKSSLGLKSSFSPLLTLGSLLAQFAGFFALGLIMLVFWPRRLDRVTTAIRQTPARSTALGMLGVLAIPVLTLLLCVTVVGIPLVLVEGVGLVASSVLGFSSLAMLIGARMPIDVGRGAQVANLAMGTGVLVLATHLPVLGWLIQTCAFVVVLGAVLSTRFGQHDGQGPYEPPPAMEP